jgi:ribosome-associated protein
MSTPLVINDTITLPASDLEWSAVRSSGAGGQNVNKVSSKVELYFDFDSSVALADDAKARLRVLAKNLLDGEGRVLVKSEKTRDQARNLADARDKIRELVLKALTVPKARKATKPTRASKKRRVDAKKKLGAKKKMRRAGKRGRDD